MLSGLLPVGLHLYLSGTSEPSGIGHWFYLNALDDRDRLGWGFFSE